MKRGKMLVVKLSISKGNKHDYDMMGNISH